MIKSLGAIGCAICLCLMTSCTEDSAKPNTEQSGERPRVGVYDSRAIAIAFVGSDAWQATEGKRLAEIKAQYNKAKAEGNKEKMSELEAEGKAQQVLLHKQGFSTAPVDDMLIHIKDQMPGIAKAADVEIIVSKWDEEALKKYKLPELVDVTMEMVKAFNPTDRQLKRAKEIQEHPPISLKEAGKIDD